MHVGRHHEGIGTGLRKPLKGQIELVLQVLIGKGLFEAGFARCRPVAASL